MSDELSPAKVRLTDGLGPTPLADEHPYTYASTQATNCACCGEYKHTPLRIDAMGGYVCLTCIDRKLGTLLGEFGYPAPQQGLTRQQIDAVMTEHYPLDSLLRENVDAFEACVRDLERLHGIGA
jgi:hypothetical protein